MTGNEKGFTAATFYNFLKNGQFYGTKCRDCNGLTVTPRSICLQCHGTNLEWTPFSGRGTLASFTCIYVVPSAMAARGFGRDTPYCSGIVALEEGPRVSALILGVDAQRPSSIEIGSLVTVDFAEATNGYTGLTFRPLK